MSVLKSPNVESMVLEMPGMILALSRHGQLPT